MKENQPYNVNYIVTAFKENNVDIDKFNFEVDAAEQELSFGETTLRAYHFDGSVAAEFILIGLHGTKLKYLATYLSETVKTNF
jgi:hypothetical protein